MIHHLLDLNTLEEKTEFPYLGRTVMYNNNDWEALYINLRKAQRRWGMVAKVLGKTGVLIKVQEMMYKAVVYVVLLYGSKILVVTDAMMMVLEGFHHRIARKVAGMTVRKGGDREWEWASVDAVL